jgi:hypothetical protein
MKTRSTRRSAFNEPIAQQNPDRKTTGKEPSGAPNKPREGKRTIMVVQHDTENTLY